jgi:hypothetical protein
VVAGNLTSGH